MDKGTALILAVFLALLAAMPAVSAVSDVAYLIEVSETSFLPDTIYAGDVVSLALKVKNKASSLSVVNLRVTLDVGNQFEAVDLQDSISLIKAGATTTIVLKFKVKEDTLPGYYPLFLSMYYERAGEPVTQTQSISVPVSKTEKSIDVTIYPRVINPGNQTEMVFTLNNVGRTPISNVSLSWEEENDLVLPLGSDNKKYLPMLEASADRNVVYVVAADPNIEPGIYPLNVTVTFTDVDGIKTQESQVGLIIGGKTDFEVSAELLGTGQLSISIANIGSNNADAVVVKIPEQKAVAVSGSSVSILGNLNKGDFTLANFEMRYTAARQDSQPSPGLADATNADRRALLIEINYTDTTGERQTVEKTVELSMASSGTSSDAASSTGFAGRAARQTGSQNSLVSWGLLALVIVGAVVFNRFRAGNSNWKSLAKNLALIAVLFLAVIFLLGSNQIAIWIVVAVSLVLLARFFRREQFSSLLRRAANYLKKAKSD